MKRGKGGRTSEKEGGKGCCGKRTLDRAIINPDVLSCQDGVNGADMTQMESRTLQSGKRERQRGEKAREKHVAQHRGLSDIYSEIHLGLIEKHVAPRNETSLMTL